MRHLVRSVAAVAAALILAAPAAQAGHLLPHKPFAQMTLRQIEQYQQRSLAFHERVVTRWRTSPDRIAALRVLRLLDVSISRIVPQSPYCQPLGARAPADVCWHAHAIAWVTRELKHTKALLVIQAQPAHAALWNCLMRYEGGYPSNQNTGGNGHWGGLQMHPGWGYGTSYHASDDPWSVQMNAAETGYRLSGYSSSYLIGQWGQTIGNCWQYK